MNEWLKRIRAANDIKELKPNQLPYLAKEIRHFLVEKVSKTGGHLASNLGVVELTLALHYVFDITKDKIVWDVGHQAYVHKILTGRKEGFDQLRQLDGLSGFPKPKESPYDSFATGHSSTSISAALGMATARDLKKGKEHIIAVIGDGSMTGGLAYEALNNAGQKNTQLMVILNDNDMSISGNVGAMNRHLRDLRTAPLYLNAKAGVHELLAKVPLVGEPMDKGIEKVKNSIKYFLVPGVMFEEMGFQYLGPVDGHNMEELLEFLTKAKQMEGPVLLHVKTKKGKGYPFAEQNPSKFHGVSPFRPKTGEVLGKKGVSYSQVFGDTLTKIAAENEKVVAITAAMCGGTGLDTFSKTYPTRFFDVGIAEQHAVTFAAGLASSGYHPVFAVYSTFLQRAYDQIVEDVCFQNLPVVFAIDRAGIVGADGETHQGIFDIGFLSHVPSLQLLAPRSGAECKTMLEEALKQPGPVAIRYPRDHVEEDWEKGVSLPWGKAEWVEEGESIAILSCGTMFETARGLWKKLKEAGKNPMLINARFIQPLDQAMLEEVAQKAKTIVTIEDHVLRGGFGDLVRHALGTKEVLVRSFGFPNQFIEQGKREELFLHYGLTPEAIAAEVLKEE